MNAIQILTWRDLIDILFLSLVAYQLYIWFRGTKALRVLIGLVVLGVVYSLAKFWGLLMTTWVFQVLWQVLVILLLILFQTEIRQVLEKVSPLRYLRARRHFFEAAVIDQLVQALFELAEERTGALIVLTREDNPTEFIQAGQPIMALPSPALIKSIFSRQSPAHDGAVVVSEGRLREMGCVLPLTDREDIPEHHGTRHRAALGLSERSDAVCLLVSEERGEVSMAVDGRMTDWTAPQPLVERLKELLGLTEVRGPSMKGFLKGVFIENWGAKIGALVLVTLAWVVLAGQLEYEISLNAPIRYLNLPPGLVLAEDSAREVRLELSGRRSQAVALRDEDIRVRVELSALSPGVHVIRLSGKDVDLPLGLRVVQVIPKNIKIILKPASGYDVGSVTEQQKPTAPARP
jgi:diadenylate cyclase